MSAFRERSTSRASSPWASSSPGTSSAPTIRPPCYPIEAVTKFELKTTEVAGWVEQTAIDYVIRRNCIISLHSALATPQSALPVARITYTGGYVLPGTTPGAGQTALPDDLEQAAVEQVAFWFKKRDFLGIKISWPNAGLYQQFGDQDLLRSVSAALLKYERWTP